ncbi:MAG: hypothetical protein ABF289_05565 [Clostridiales bacterium]
MNKIKSRYKQNYFKNTPILNIGTMDINKWVKADGRSKRIKTLIMYFYGYEDCFIAKKLKIKLKTVKKWIYEVYSFKRPICNININENNEKDKNKMRLQDGKSDWVSEIMCNFIKNKNINGKKVI